MGTVASCQEFTKDEPERHSRGINIKNAQQVEHWHGRMRESRASQQLFEAAVTGDVQKCMTSLVAHGNPNCCNPDGLTPLMMSAAGGHVEVTQLLITAGARVNATPGDNGVSPLSLGAAQGCLEIVRMLLEWQADPNIGHDVGNTALMRAAAAGHIDVCAVLTKAHADPNVADNNGVTATMLSVDRGHLEATQLLVEAEASLESVDRSSCSALSRVVDVLLRLDPAGSSDFGVARPFLASFDYWAEMASIMAERHADVNLTDSHGDTLLARTVRHRRRDVGATLLDLGAKVDSPVLALNGGPVLLLAVELEHREMCRLLVDRAASVDLSDRSGQTGLSLAIEHGDEALCFLLLDRGARPDVRDRHGQTLLMKSAERGLKNVYDRMLQVVRVEAVGRAGTRAPVSEQEETLDAEYAEDGDGEIQY